MLGAKKRIPWNKGKKGPSGKDHPMYGKKHSGEARKRIGVAAKGRKPWNKGKKGPSGKDHPMYGRKHSEESIQKMSKSIKINLKDFRDNALVNKCKFTLIAGEFIKLRGLISVC